MMAIGAGITIAELRRIYGERTSTWDFPLTFNDVRRLNEFLQSRGISHDEAVELLQGFIKTVDKLYEANTR